MSGTGHSDHSDHYCLFHRRVLPDRYPVQPRPEMAAMPSAVVATRGAERLLCNQEHDGPHLWPNGDEALELDEHSTP